MAEDEGEIVREAARAKAARERAKASQAKRWPIALGVGIGSAALAAALLYTRDRKD